MPTWLTSRLCRPIWQLWPISTRLSILVPVADPRRPESAAVDRRAGADLDVVADLDVAELRHLDVPAVLEPVAEAVGPEHGVGVDDRRGGRGRCRRRARRGGTGHVVAEPAVSADDDAAVDAAAGADDAAFADDGERVDARVRAQARGRMDDGERIDAVRRRVGPAVQVAGDGDEGRQRVGDADQSFAVGGRRRRDDRGTGRAGVASRTGVCRYRRR